RLQVQVLRHRRDQFVAEPAAVLLLRLEQALDHRRTLPPGRELGDPMVDVGTGLVAQRDLRIDILDRFEIAGCFHAWTPGTRASGLGPRKSPDAMPARPPRETKCHFAALP